MHLPEFEQSSLKYVTNQVSWICPRSRSYRALSTRLRCCEAPARSSRDAHLQRVCSAKQLIRGEPNVSYICSRYYRAPELIFGATDYTSQIGRYRWTLTLLADWFASGVCCCEPTSSLSFVESAMKFFISCPTPVLYFLWLLPLVPDVCSADFDPCCKHLFCRLFTTYYPLLPDVYSVGYSPLVIHALLFTPCYSPHVADVWSAGCVLAELMLVAELLFVCSCALSAIHALLFTPCYSPLVIHPLLFTPCYSPCVTDVWSAGCVLAELLLGVPIFPGDSGVDQLVEIIKVLGTPTRDQIREMNPNYQEFKFPQIKAHPWSKVSILLASKHSVV